MSLLIVFFSRNGDPDIHHLSVQLRPTFRASVEDIFGYSLATASLKKNEANKDKYQSILHTCSIVGTRVFKNDRASKTYHGDSPRENLAPTLSIGYFNTK